jgi:hypothetical protein
MAGLTRFLPALVVAANLAAALGWMQAILTGLFPWSHHWIFPCIAVQLLAQAFLFRTRGPGAALAGLSALLLGIAVARLPTIHASHHLIHFAMAFGLCAVLHRRLAGWAAPAPWPALHRWWAVLYAAVAVVSALLAWHAGIWWGIRDGT